MISDLKNTHINFQVIKNDLDESNMNFLNNKTNLIAKARSICLFREYTLIQSDTFSKIKGKL